MLYYIFHRHKTEADRIICEIYGDNIVSEITRQD